jgi:hypothetical protein
MRFTISDPFDYCQSPRIAPFCFDRLLKANIDGCDGNDPNNPKNHKFGSSFTGAEGWQYWFEALAKHPEK